MLVRGRAEIQRQRIDTITQAAGRRAIVKYMPEMGVAPAAADFHPRHAMAVITEFMKTVIIDRCPETGPATAGIILLLRAE